MTNSPDSGEFPDFLIGSNPAVSLTSQVDDYQPLADTYSTSQQSLQGSNNNDYGNVMRQLNRKYSVTNPESLVNPDIKAEYVRLKKEYEKCLNARNEISIKANSYRKLYDASNLEIIQSKKNNENLKSTIEQHKKQILELNSIIEKLKIELENKTQELNKKSLNHSDSYPLASSADSNERVSAKDSKNNAYTQPDSGGYSAPIPSVDAPVRFSPSPLNLDQLNEEYTKEQFFPFHEARRPEIYKNPVQLSFFSDEQTIQIPSPEEMEVFQARQNSLRTQIDELYQQISEDKKKYDDSQILIHEKEKTIQQLQNTVQTLEKALSEQRDLFNERLLNYKNEATRYIESMMIEKKDIDNNDIQSHNGNASEYQEELSIISSRLVEFERRNTKLKEELEYSQESLKMMQRHNRDLQMKVDLLTSQKLAIEERNLQPDRRDSLEQYTTRLNKRYNDLKRKYESLQAEYDELKNKKANRFDPFMMTNVIDKAIERNRLAHQADSGYGNEKKLISKVKTTEITADNLRARNEELQQLLNKSNNTIDRLNQLLARKETQLAAFHEQIADLKQQIIVLSSGK